MKDKDLRKAFENLVSQLGGEVHEYLYSVGGVYGIDKQSSFLRAYEKNHLSTNYQFSLLLDYLNLTLESGERIVKKKKLKP